MRQVGDRDGQVLQQRTTYSVNVALYEIPPDDEDEVEDVDGGADAVVLGAGLPTAAGDEEATLAGAEEAGKPGFFFGSVPSLSMPSPPDSSEGLEGMLDPTVVGRAASAVPVPEGMMKPVDTSPRVGKEE